METKLKTELINSYNGATIGVLSILLPYKENDVIWLDQKPLLKLTVVDVENDVISIEKNEVYRRIHCHFI